MARLGLYRCLPCRPSSVTKWPVVDAVGAAVAGFRAGDRVLAARFGGCDFRRGSGDAGLRHSSPTHRHQARPCRELPDSVGASPGEVGAGDTVLVYGAGGGCRHRGNTTREAAAGHRHRPASTSRSTRFALGIDHAVDHQRRDIAAGAPATSDAGERHPGSDRRPPVLIATTCWRRSAVSSCGVSSLAAGERAAFGAPSAR